MGARFQRVAETGGAAVTLAASDESEIICQELPDVKSAVAIVPMAVAR